MNYTKFSTEWQQKLEPYLQANQGVNWDEIYKFYDFDKNDRAKQDNLIVLSEGVWMKIDDVYGFRKIRGITKSDVYYDSTYPDFYSAYSLGGLYTRFVIDGNILDLTLVDKHERQTKLLEFIKQTTGISDNALPVVPKGILKL